MEAIQAKRVFKLKGKLLSDPDPNMSADEVMDFYSLSNPEIASAKLVGPDMDVEKGEMVYEFKTEIASKG